MRAEREGRKVRLRSAYRNCGFCVVPLGAPRSTLGLLAYFRAVIQILLFPSPGEASGLSGAPRSTAACRPSSTERAARVEARGPRVEERGAVGLTFYVLKLAKGFYREE